MQAICLSQFQTRRLRENRHHFQSLQMAGVVHVRLLSLSLPRGAAGLQMAAEDIRFCCRQHFVGCMPTGPKVCFLKFHISFHCLGQLGAQCKNCWHGFRRFPPGETTNVSPRGQMIAISIEVLFGRPVSEACKVAFCMALHERLGADSKLACLGKLDQELLDGILRPVAMQ